MNWYITSDPTTLIFDANDVTRKLAECLKTCLNPPRGRGEKRIGTLAREDGPFHGGRFFGPSGLDLEV